MYVKSLQYKNPLMDPYENVDRLFSSLKWKYQNLKHALATNIHLISSHVIGFLQDSCATEFSF